MDQNDNKNKGGRGGKNGGSWRGVVQLVCWALLLTIVIKIGRASCRERV